METDIKIELLLKKVEEKKQAVKSAERPTWKTNCSFRWSANETQNLQVVSDPDTLVRMLAHVLKDKEAFSAATEVLGVKGSYNYYGASYEDWLSDIKTRLNIVQVTKTKKELALLEEKLNELQSPELKAKRAIEEIEKLLDD